MCQQIFKLFVFVLFVNLANYLIKNNNIFICFVDNEKTYLKYQHINKFVQKQLNNTNLVAIVCAVTRIQIIGREKYVFQKF